MAQQRKISTATIIAVEKKMQKLRERQHQVTKQTTPLKITLRKFIQQNMERLQHTDACQLNWAIYKIRRGYFGDASLQNMLDVITDLRKKNFLQ